MPKQIHVVAAVIRDGGHVLACRRGPGIMAAGKWEFPGGKVEADESPEDALVREIAEELGSEIAVGELLDRTATRVGDVVIDLACYDVQLTGPRPESSTDHDRLAWVDPRRLDELDWATPDLPVVAVLVAAEREPS